MSPFTDDPASDAPTEAEPIVEMTAVSRTFDSEPPVIAVRSVTLRILAGDSVAIVGPSGSGKSSLLNLIGCLDRATAGSYCLSGVDVTDLDERELAAVRATMIGFVFQSFHLLSQRTVLENVMLGELYSGGDRRSRRERAEHALASVGLAERSTFLPTRLSGGERQRVAIARALIRRPALLLCDEPTGNLDSTNTSGVLELFDQLNREGLTILTSTHDMNVASHARRRLEMRDGSLTELVATPVGGSG